ncbi:MAG: hypothetical protein C0518_01980 [Opitutus sp.]|nr:hypothetical protein [Opitutus sp.]
MVRVQELTAPPPPAPPPPLPFICLGAHGGKATVWIDTAADRVSWSAALSAGASWVSVSSGATGRGFGLVELEADPSTGAERTATLTVTFSDARPALTWPVTQASAVPLATLSDNVLQVPFIDAPRIMELAILGRFAAQEIAKVPEPFTLPVLAIVEALIPILGELVIALRTAADALVPQTKTWCPPPNTYAPLIEIEVPSSIIVHQQVAELLVYLPEQFAEAQAGD